MVNVLLNLYNFDEDWCFNSLKHIIKSNFKVLIIPFSFHENWMRDDNEWQNAYNPDYGNYYDDIIKPFKRYEIEETNIDWINYFIDTKETSINKILNSDLIFFTGGLPDKMMDRLKEFEIIKILENYKGVIMGSSAGAMIQLKEYSITPDKDYDTFTYNEGLSIINDFYIEVHYKETDIQNESIKRILSEKSKPIYAIKDQGGIIVKNKTIELLGDVKLNTL